MSREQGGKRKKNVKASLNKKDVQQNSVFEKYSESELISQLKELALDPYCPQFARDNIRPLYNHILLLRKVMILNNSEIPEKKRKPDQQNISKESRRKLSHSASVSCMVNVSESTKPSADKTILYSHSSNSSSTFHDPLLENCQNKDMIQKCVIPIGPRFQAVVPEFSGTFDKNALIDQYKKNSDNLKWLGTQSWPTEKGDVRNIDKPIGKGRPDICRCMTPSSVECVKRHCLEALVFLQRDLGPAFFSWKFDEMGEQIAKQWTLKEQQSFVSLMKARQSTNGKNFLKRALKSIPKKSRKEIVNYYFNVHIPRRISMQTRSSSKKVVDSDDEDEPKGYKGKVVTTSKSKKVNDQYLRAFP